MDLQLLYKRVNSQTLDFSRGKKIFGDKNVQLDWWERIDFKLTIAVAMTEISHRSIFALLSMPKVGKSLLF